jgi:hypothetical protein
VPEIVFLRFPAGLADERIVLRHPAVVVQADDRTRVIVGLLRAVALAERDEKVAVAIEHESRAEMHAGGAFRLLAEDHLDVLQAIARQPAARDLGPEAGRITAGVGKIDEVVLGEAGMQRDVEQPALADGRDLRQSGNRLRVEPAVLADDAEPPWALGDQHSAVGKKGESPGMVEPLGHAHDADRVLLGLDCLRGGGHIAQCEDSAHRRHATRTGKIHN